MIIKDRLGNELHEGDEVFTSYNGELVPGVVLKIETGVGTNIAATNQGIMPAQPIVITQLLLATLVLPDGTAAQLIRGKKSEQPVKTGIIS